MTGPRPGLEVLGPGPGAADDRTPVLFVPGLGHAAHCWDHWRGAADQAGRPAYAMSLRGHGASARRLRLARMGQYRDDVIEVASSLPSAPVLIGHSMGALVCAMAAAEFPTAGLVMVAGIPAHPGIGSLALVAKQHPVDALSMIAGRTLRPRPEYLYEQLDPATAAAHIAQTGKESALAQHQILFHRPPAAPRGGAPVLSIGATADRLVPIRDVRATARRYGATLREFDGIGHNMMQDVGWEGPWQAIAQWLATVDAGRRTEGRRSADR